jgi:hypothetical protein
MICCIADEGISVCITHKRCVLAKLEERKAVFCLTISNTLVTAESSIGVTDV